MDSSAVPNRLRPATMDSYQPKSSTPPSIIHHPSSIIDRSQSATNHSSSTTNHPSSTIQSSIDSICEDIAIALSITLLAESHLLFITPRYSVSLLSKIILSLLAKLSVSFTQDTFSSSTEPTHVLLQGMPTPVLTPTPPSSNVNKLVYVIDGLSDAPRLTQLSLLETMLFGCVRRSVNHLAAPTHVSNPLLVIAIVDGEEGLACIPDQLRDRFLISKYIRLSPDQLNNKKYIIENVYSALSGVQGMPRALEIYRQSSSTIDVRMCKDATLSLSTSIYIHPDILRYLRCIIINLRNHSNNHVGPTPRVISALVIVIKIMSYLDNSTFVTPHLAEMGCRDVLLHRLNPCEARGVDEGLCIGKTQVDLVTLYLSSMEGFSTSHHPSSIIHPSSSTIHSSITSLLPKGENVTVSVWQSSTIAGDYLTDVDVRLALLNNVLSSTTVPI